MIKEAIPLLKESSWPFIMKVSSAFISLLFTYVVTLYLSPKEFGAYSLSIILILTFVTIAKFGLENTVVKYTSIYFYEKNKDNIEMYYTIALIISAVSASLTMLVVWMVKDSLIQILHQKLLTELFPLIILIIFPNTLIIINASLMRGFGHPNYAIAFNSLITISLTIITIPIFSPDSAVKLLFITMVLSYFTLIISFIINLHKLKIRFNLKITPLKIIMTNSKPLWISSIVSLIIQQASSIILAMHASLESVGIFVLASKISLSSSFILFAVNIVISPKFAFLYKNNEIHKLKSLMSTSNKVLLLVSLIVSGAIFVFAENIMAIFGSHFTVGADWLRILICGQFVNISVGSTFYLLVMTGYQRLHQRNVIFCAIITLILMFTLIPSYGAFGAAISTAVSMSIQNLISYYYSIKKVLAIPAIK